MPEASAILRRRERDEDLPFYIRLAIKRKLRTDTALSAEHRIVLQEALYDDDAIEVLRAQAQEQGLTSDGAPRDWAGFFAALASFLERIIPLLLQLFGGIGA